MTLEEAITRKCPFCGGPIDPDHMSPLLKPVKEECWDCPWYKKIVEIMAPLLMMRPGKTGE